MKTSLIKRVLFVLLAKKSAEDIGHSYDVEHRLGNIVNAQIR